MKVNVLLIGIVLALMLVAGNVIAQGEFPDSPRVVAEAPNLWEKIVNFFSAQTFTIVGQDRGCDTEPFYKSGQTIYFARGFTLGYWSFDSGTTAGGSSQYTASAVCSSGHALFDVYCQTNPFASVGQLGTPRFEMKDSFYFSCSSNCAKCNVEVYCCPDDCAVDGICSTGEECVTKLQTDSTMPLIDLYGNTITSYKYCKEIQGCTGPDKTCYRIGSSNTCESATYSCDYSTYQEIINTDCVSGAGSYIYGSEGECTANICVDISWTPSPSTVCSGESFIQTSNCGKTRNSVGTKDCNGDIQTCAEKGGECKLTYNSNTETDLGKYDCGLLKSCIVAKGEEECPQGQTLCSDGVCREDCGTAPPKGLPPPECIEDQGIFYTDGYAVIGSGNFKFLGYSSESTSGDVGVINTKDLQAVVPGLSAKYYENRGTACCEDLKAYFDDEKSAQYSRTDFSLLSLFGVGYLDKIKGWFGVEREDDIERVAVTYSVYKCVPPEEAGFCLEVAQKWLNPLTHVDDCQTNTIIFILITVFGFIVVARFAG